MASQKQSSPKVLSVGMYLIQIALVLLVVLHHYNNKDSDIVVALLIAIYGMITAQTTMESAFSGIRFLGLMKRLGQARGAEQPDQTGFIAELEDFTTKEAPYTLVHSLFGFVIALVGVAKLVYAILVE